LPIHGTGCSGKKPPQPKNRTGSTWGGKNSGIIVFQGKPKNSFHRNRKVLSLKRRKKTRDTGKIIVMLGLGLCLKGRGGVFTV